MASSGRAIRYEKRCNAPEPTSLLMVAQPHLIFMDPYSQTNNETYDCNLREPFVDSNVDGIMRQDK